MLIYNYIFLFNLIFILTNIIIYVIILVVFHFYYLYQSLNIEKKFSTKIFLIFY